jgi:hypothetical protein
MSRLFWPHCFWDLAASRCVLFGRCQAHMYAAHYAASWILLLSGTLLGPMSSTRPGFFWSWAHRLLGWERGPAPRAPSCCRVASSRRWTPCAALMWRQPLLPQRQLGPLQRPYPLWPACWESQMLRRKVDRMVDSSKGKKQLQQIWRQVQQVEGMQEYRGAGQWRAWRGCSSPAAWVVLRMTHRWAAPTVTAPSLFFVFVCGMHQDSCGGCRGFWTLVLL